MQARRRYHWIAGLIGLGVLGGSLAECGYDGQALSAHQSKNRADLVGGVRALGDVGDFVLENDLVRVVIQGPGSSRGVGIYGGSLIDADLRRPGNDATGGRASGNDLFGELFPAFFLQAVNVQRVFVERDGSDGAEAVVVAEGSAGDFLELIGVVNRLAVGSHVVSGRPESEQRVRYRIAYTLRPGESYVRIVFSIENISQERLLFPAADALSLLGLIGLDLQGLRLPIGDIALFGNALEVFMPGVGFDVRFGLEAAYQNNIQLPAFPGLVTDVIAARGDNVSYALLAAARDDNYVFQNRDIYGQFSDVGRDSMVLPFVASGFLGVFHTMAPEGLDAGARFEVEKYFIIGSGDVASVMDQVHVLRGEATGRLTGQALDTRSSAPVQDVRVLVFARDAGGERELANQLDPRAGGFFAADLPEGAYSHRVVGPGRWATNFVDFDIRAGETTFLRVLVEPPAEILVGMVDDSGLPLPGKATAVGTVPVEQGGVELRDVLFDLSMGEPWRYGDLVPDTADPATRQFVESVAHADWTGRARLSVRPGTYRIVGSRGPEYGATEATVTVSAGEVAQVSLTVPHVVDTPGWISGDMHLHAINSIDSGTTLATRVAAVAAEGVDWAVSTDHNFITDYSQTIEQLRLGEWLRSSVGLEVTTLETGHFNGYPLRFEPGPVGNGSFEWQQIPPGEIFERLRALGAHGPEQTVVQINHPREQITGYFNQFDRNGIDLEPYPVTDLDNLIRIGTGGGALAPTGPAFRDPDTRRSTFSLEADVMETLNGKLFWQIHHFRVPPSIPPLGPDDPPVSSIVLDEDGEMVAPGAVDDWYNLLNLGHRIMGVGTSDSHAGDGEPGYFRTMIRCDADSPRDIDERDLTRALRAGQAYATNGPILDVHLGNPDTEGLGATVVRADGAATLHVGLRAAPWVSVSRINVIVNGLIARVVMIDPDRNLAADPFETDIPLSFTQDSWVVVEVLGDRSLFPVVLPVEVPPVDLSDAIGSIAGPLGLTGGEGLLEPIEVFPVTAVALTNPIWVRLDPAQEWRAPGVPSLAVRNEPENDPGFYTVGAARPSVPAPVAGSSTPLRITDGPTRTPTDIRRLFRAFSGH